MSDVATGIFAKGRVVPEDVVLFYIYICCFIYIYIKVARLHYHKKVFHQA